MEPILTLVKKCKQEGVNGKAIEDLYKLLNDFIFSIAERVQETLLFCDASVEKEDLLQAGFIGLQEAVIRFDTTREVKFTTFAYWPIFNKMKYSINCKNSTFSLEEKTERNIIPKSLMVSINYYNKHNNNRKSQLCPADIINLYKKAYLQLQTEQIIIVRLLCENGWKRKEIAQILSINKAIIDNTISRVILPLFRRAIHHSITIVNLRNLLQTYLIPLSTK